MATEGRGAAQRSASSRGARASNARGRYGDWRTIDYVVVALHGLGGSTRSVDIEDIAIECHRLAPHRFRWRRYADQVDIAQVRDGLSDGRKPQHGGVTVGDRKQGWMLTTAGQERAQVLVAELGGRASGARIDVPVRAAERQRVHGSVAYRKTKSGADDQVTASEFRQLLRVDRYVTDEKYQQRLALVLGAFADEPETQEVIRALEHRYREGRLG